MIARFQPNAPKRFPRTAVGAVAVLLTAPVAAATTATTAWAAKPKAAPATAGKGGPTAVTPAPASAAPAPSSAPAPGAAAEFAALYAEAQGLYSSGNYKAALAAYEKAYALSPEPEPLFGVARCFHQLGRLEEATAHYEKFLEAAPMHSGVPKARAHLVDALGAVGAKALGLARWEDARRAYARAVELNGVADAALKDPTSGVLLAGLGEALAGLGRSDEALANLRRALAAALGAELRARTEATVARLESPSKPRSSRIVWIAVGGGAAAVIGAVAAVLLVLLLPRPYPRDTALGIWDVTLRENGR